MPTTYDEAKMHMAEMSLAGFPGCIGSTDATHVAMDSCAYKLRQSHSSFKLPYPARTYNITVNHRRCILHSTGGHPARWNDKTLQRFDNFMTGLQSGRLLNDVHFQLYDTNDNGDIIKVRYTGAWVIVDNGYLNVPTCIPPMKAALTREDERWSQWVESMRKDVECTFGIMKKRWRILKHPIRLRGVETTDKVWRTCCALHNMLLESDGLNTEWTEGVPAGNASILDGSISSTAPFAISRLHNTTQICTPHVSCESYTDSTRSTSSTEDAIMEVSFINENIVRNMSHTLFQKKLIKHFDICFKRNEIVWPQQQEKSLV